MTTISALFTPLIAPVTWALVHFMWQGALVAAALSVVLGLQRGSSAAVRYRTACVALVVMIAFPIVTAVTYDGASRSAYGSAGPAAATSVGATRPAPASANSQATPPAGGISADDQARRTTSEAIVSLLPTLDRLRPWLFVVWLVGVLALSLFHVLGWRRVQQLKHEAVEPAPAEWQESITRLCECLGIPRAVSVLKSACVEVPTVIGWLSPVVLIPVGAFTGLAPEQLRDVLVHELAHIKRRDYLINLVQVVAETLLFFHPAVWWVSRQIRTERENCCDDFAVAMSEDRLAYAKALVRLEELRMCRPDFVMRADGGSLTSRIRRITGGNNMQFRHNRPWLSGVILASLLVVGGAALSMAIDRPGMKNQKKSSAQPDASYSTAADDFSHEGRWEIDHYGDVAVLEIRIKERNTRMNMSIEFDEDEFAGLDFGEDDEFALVRDAGTFYFVGDFEGSGRKLEGDGRFGFVPNEDFEDEVDGNFDDHELLILAAKDVGFEYIEKMEKIGYDRIDGDELVPLAIHGVSLDFAGEMRDSGYDVSLDKLVKFRIHGVSPDYVHEMADLGYDHVSADGLLKWKIHGVSPEFVRAMDKAGVEPLRSEDLVKMKIHGVSPDFVHGMHEAGFGSLDTDQLVKWRIHGVSPDFVHGMHEAGVDHMSTNDLTRMRIHGVSPSYVRELDDLGYSNIDVDDLVRMKIHGVTPSYVKRVLDKVKEPPSIDNLVKMKIHGIYH
jgi:beta-lactamase regulating signal transducer with metallopeptidase domain